MIRWERLATATAPGANGGGVELRLMRRGAEVSIMIGGEELMNSRRGGSETALGAAACERLAGRAAPCVLIGGLGLGFTLRAVLAGMGADARITVAELVPEVVAWARGPLADLFAGSLDDARVRVVERDVGELIRDARSTYDAVLLDVDNGPDGLVAPSNEALYGPAALQAARCALKPGGLLAVWSAGRDSAFSRRLARAGFTVQEVTSRSAGARGGARHIIWLAAARQGDPAAAVIRHTPTERG